MAKYTWELGDLIERGFDIGLKDYPIYEESHREELNSKIKDYFYFREIGLETPELFKRHLNRKMRMIMPYYNQLYKSEAVEFNPLYNIEIHETYEHQSKTDGLSNMKGSSNQTTKASDESSSDTKSDTGTSNRVDNDLLKVESDTPQSGLTSEDIKSNKYASRTVYDDNTVVTTDDTTTTTTGNTKSSQNASADSTSTNDINTEQNTVDSYKKTTEGSSAGLPFSKAIKQWREIMLNIDLMICEELEPLFMQIF